MSRILIVDDNADNLYLLESVLRGNGDEVLVASNGAEALTRAREALPDLVISDILMPVMDGFSLCRAWRQDPLLRELPFVFYTATYTDPKDEQFALSLGADLFVVKPTEPDVFLGLVRDVLSKYRAGQIKTELRETAAEPAYLREYNQILINKLEKKLGELEEANRGLAEKDAFNRAVMNAMTMHVAVLDRAGNVLDANDAWKRVARGKAMPEFRQAGVGANLFDVCRSESGEVSQACESVLAGIRSVLGGETAEFQTEFSCDVSGDRHWYLMRVTPLGSPMAGAVAACFEVTRRVQAELERGEIAARFQALFNAVADAIHLYEMGGDGLPTRLLEVNDAACTLLGYSREEFLEMPTVDLQKLSGAGGRSDWDTMKAGHCVLREQMLPAKDGQEIPVEVQAYALESQGRWVMFTIAHDLRARRQLETERLRLEDQLRQAQKMEAVGQLAGGVAHDFNNVLQAICGYVELARQDLPESNPVSSNLQEVGKAVERATTLVRQLLAFSRRETIQEEWVDLNALINDLLPMLHRLIGEHVELQFTPGKKLRSLRMDRGHVEQVLVNLCVNARDAMPNGGRLLIETENVDLDEEYCRANAAAKCGEYAALVVSDTGLGIPSAIRDRIFEPFFTTKRPGEGTGLGLATVYAIVQRGGGFLNLYSEEGFGTTFRVYFPASAVAPSAVSAAAQGDGRSHQGQGELVLLAEDDVQLRELAVRMLEKAGYRVVAARDGEEAMALFAEHKGRIAVALLDVMMPKKTGRMVYEAIRSQGSDIPILLASGYSFSLLEEGQLPVEGYNLIRKPYRQTELLEKLREALDRKCRA